jgi:glycosyltransferase involved in cell wall biosynthesis
MIAGREFFHPFDQRLYKEMLAFKNAGHTITLVTPDPGEGTEYVDGMKVIKVPNMGRGPTAPRMVRTCKDVDCNAYHAHEFDGGYVGAVLKLLTGRPVFYDVHDNVPGLLAEIKHNPRLEKIYDRIERRMIMVMTGIVLAGDSLTPRYSKLHKQTVVINNYPLLDSFSSGTDKPDLEKNPHLKELSNKLDGKFVLGFTGGLSLRLGVLDMLDGISELKNEDGIHLLLIGRFDRPDDKERILARLKKYKLEDQVTIEKWVDYQKLPGYLKLMDVGLALQQPIKRLLNIPPTKLFDYMASSKPVIATNLPGLAKLVNKHKCGILVEPNNKTNLVDAIKELHGSPELCRKLGRSGRKAVAEKYNWTAEGEKLVEFYTEQLNLNSK